MKKSIEPTSFSDSKKTNPLLYILLFVVIAVGLFFIIRKTKNPNAQKTEVISVEQKQDFVNYVKENKVVAPTTKEVSSFIERSKQYEQPAQ